MGTFHDIEEQIEAILDAMNEAGDEMSGPEWDSYLDNLTKVIEELGDAEAAKADAIVAVIKRKEARIAERKAIIEALQNKTRADQADIDRIKGFTFGTMKKFGLQKIKGLHATLFVSKRKKTNIIDEKKVLELFPKVTTTVDRTKLNEALKDGVEVPGAEVVEIETLNVRRA